MKDLKNNNRDNIFVDTNVLIGYFAGLEKDKKCLDYLFSTKIQKKKKRLYISSLSIAQFVATFQRRKVSDEKIRKQIKYYQTKFNVIEFTEKDVDEALKFDIIDMEDAIQFILGKKVKCLYYITNNIKDYKDIDNIILVKPSQEVAKIK